MRDKWIPGLSVREEMLRELGLESVEELFKDIPVEARVRGWESLPIGEGRSLSEQEVRERLEERYKNIVRVDPRRLFLGGGAYASYQPSYIGYIRGLGEILTSYTPYQAEISQGLLQALFEYQSLIAELYDMDVVNSSHYDWSTAAAEAALMALRVHRGRRRRIVVLDTVNPWRLQVVRAYVEPHGVEIVRAPTSRETGEAVLDRLEELVDDNTAAVYVEAPSAIGIVDSGLETIGEIAHRRGSLYIVGMDPVAASLYRPPGSLGADIAVGDGQPLGLGLNYGGPYLGIMATRLDNKLIRQFPGRIVGLARDADGRRAYTLILQTREQHIRRAKATSNITTNEALMSILAAAYIAGHGGAGLRLLAEAIRGNTLRVRRLLAEKGFWVLSGEVFREVLVDLPCSFNRVSETMWRDYGFLIGPGIPVGEGPAWASEGMGVIAVSEYHSQSDLELLVSALEDAVALC